MTIVQRAKSPTPNFFKKLRLAGIILSAVSAVLLGGKNAKVKEIASHVATAGAVIAAVSQVTVDEKALKGFQSTIDSGDGK